MIAALVLFILLATMGCSKKSYIDIYYMLPHLSNSLAGKKVYLEIKDFRKDKVIFTKAASENFNYFTGLFSLTLKEDRKKDLLLGAYELPNIYEEAFKQRLKTLGIDLVKEKSNEVQTFEVVLKEFKIDLVKHKWVADVSYEASLIKDSQVIAREIVRGKTERFKLIGSREAEKAISELFSEIINKLDINRLFGQTQTNQ